MRALYFHLLKIEGSKKREKNIKMKIPAQIKVHDILIKLFQKNISCNKIAP